MFLPCLSLFVCEKDISKSYAWIRTKLDGHVGCVITTNRLGFGEHLGAIILLIFLSDSSALRNMAKMIYSTIFQKVMDGL